MGQAAKFVDSHYSFGTSAVIFKPTSSHSEKPCVAMTRPHAIKHFSNPLLEWVIDISLENAVIVTKGSYVFAQGTHELTLATGHKKVIDYTFGYEQDEHGTTRLFLHHSSIAADKDEKLTHVEGTETENVDADQGVAEEVRVAQEMWATALLNVADAARMGADVETHAKELVDNFYSYKDGHVLFKTTSGNGAVLFADGRENVVKYFGNPMLAALAGLRLDNLRIVVKGNLVFAMGSCEYICGDTVLSGEYTFGYERKADGALRIFFQHSSTPFN